MEIIDNSKNSTIKGTFQKKLPNCIFGGCVLNVDKHIIRVFKNIMELAKRMDDYRILIYYDESTDNTLRLLKALQKKFDGKMEIFINDPENITEYRTKNIAKGRNWIHDRCEELNREHAGVGVDAGVDAHIPYRKWKYMVMMDMDEICADDIDISLLYYYFYYKNEWDCLTFNRQKYYDIWALSYEHYVVSCWNWGDSSKSVIAIMMRNIIQKLGKMNIDELLPVNSAFNGFAIYRLEKFAGCSYDWKTPALDTLDSDHIATSIAEFKSIRPVLEFSPYCEDEEKEDCEHREFHRQAIEKHGARIRISPAILFDEPPPKYNPWLLYDITLI